MVAIDMRCVNAYSCFLTCMCTYGRGYGDTDCPVDCSEYTFEHLTQDVSGLLHALGYSACVLIGHDWGGVVAW